MPGWLRRLLPWAVGAAFLAYLFVRVPWTGFLAALAAGPYLRMSLFILVQVTVTLVADGWATAVSLGAAGVRRPAGEVLLVRGATYLLGQINYALGQGGVGIYLHRTGAPGRQASGAILFMIAINGAVLLALAVAVWPFARGSAPPRAALALAAVALAAALALYRVGRSGRWRAHALVAPWLQAGVGGILLSAGARLVHVASLVVGLWAVMRIWGIPVPLVEGLLRMPVVLLVAALPISPSGLGTTQTAQVLLFSSFALEGSAAARESAVLACGLFYHVVGVAVQVLLAAYCLLRLRRAGIAGIAGGTSPPAERRGEGPAAARRGRPQGPPLR